MDAEILFLSLLLILQIQVNSCLPKYSININQTIKEGEYLASKGNNFALGFFSPGNSSYRYLGIWYYKVQQKTVVWVANRNHPINDSSGILSFDQYGNLILYSGSYRQVPVWSTNVSTEVTDTCVAQLLDSGNFLLVQDRRRKILWQSFDYPTNFMLPGMKLGLDRRRGIDRFLTSWRSADDPGTGNYSVKVNPNGSPQLVLYKGREISYRTAPWPWKRHTNLYSKNFVNHQDEVYCVYTIPDDSITLSLMLDHLGFFNMLMWDESDGQWKEFWKVPQNRCDFYGRCGAYSTCQPNNANRFECACLPGYEPKNLSDWLVRDGSGGCVRKRMETSLACGPGDGFVKVESVLLPDTSAAVWMDVSNSDSDCEQECKRNCSCSAYASIDFPGKESGCLILYGELIDTAYDRPERHDLFVRVDALELAKNASKPNGSLEKERLAILSPLVASVWFIICLFAYFGLRKIWKTGTSVSNVLRGSCNNTDFEFFKLRTLCAATDSFSPANKLGEGGFGSVYKGHLPNGQEVAVKRLSKNSGEGIEGFKNEVTVIAKLQHRNLVKLVGCCIQGEERMLIYEYLPNKSLDLFLFDETRKALLDWSKRFEIIVGIARGILYLHQDSRLRIIHRDLKCSNILLDSEMNPKISDFGVAKIFGNDQIQGNTNRVVGTYGYMSPEYAVFGKYSVKSDVFSFGVMLLEIVSGRKNSGCNPQDSSLNLIGHAWELWKEDRALEIVDSSLKGLYHPQEALKCIQIGLLCVQEDAMDRPSMLAVVFMLNSNETALASPKQPAFIFREPANNPCTPSVVKEEDDEFPMTETMITRSPEL